jgi:hypothetical protein
MGLIRKTLRVATLPAGPLGVKASSRKQRVAKATLREAQAQTKLLSATQEALEAATQASHDKHKRELTAAKRELVGARTRASRARRRGLVQEAEEHDLMADLLRDEIERLRNLR